MASETVETPREQSDGWWQIRKAFMCLRLEVPPPVVDGIEATVHHEFARLRAALAEAERDRDEWRDSSLLAERQRDGYAGQCSALRSELARKDAALGRYGQHGKRCAMHYAHRPHDAECSCGFTAALASPTAEKGTT